MRNIVLLAVLTVIALARPLQAQTFQPELFDALGTGWFSRYYWVDFNGDGAYDVLEVDSYDAALIHLSQGDGYTSSSISFDDLWFAEGRCKFNDYDGDGDVDILASRRSEIVIVKNGGAAVFSVVSTGITFNDAEYGDIEWLDVDGDLDLDVIHERKIFLNQAGAYVESRFRLPESVFKKKWDDVNGDGLLDIISGYGYDSYDGSEVAVLLNQGEGNFNGAAIILPEERLLANTIALIDADGDSDVDVFVMDWFARGLIFMNSFAQNGSVQFTATTIFSNLSLSRALSGDLNSDGRPDLVVAGSNILTALTNTSSGEEISFAPQTLEVQMETLHSIELFDIDQDNDLDIHIKGHSSWDGVVNLAFVNTTSPQGSPPSAPLNLSTVVGKNVSLGWDETPGLAYNVELKRNGAVYKASSTSAGKRQSVPADFFLTRNGTLTLRGLPAGHYEWRVQALDPSGRGSMFSTTQMFDIADAPSLTLQALSLRHVKLCWSYNGTGTPTFIVFRGSDAETAIEIAEVGPGINCYEDTEVPENQGVEYFVVAVNSNVYSAGSNKVQHYSSLFKESSFGTSDPNIISTRCFAADFDMDEDYDLEFIGYVAGAYNYLLKNNGTGTYTPAGPMLPAGSIQVPYTEMAGARDLDNDGDLDMVVITGESYSWQRVSVYINNEGEFLKGFETPEHLGIYQLAVEDMNRDGRPDLLFSHVIGNAQGNPHQYQLLYQTVDGGFEDSRISFSSAKTTTMAHFRCADLNSDGFTDILWISADNSFTEILVNEGGMAFSKRTSTLPLVYNMGIADYSGDGIIDVMIRGNEGLNLYFGTGDFAFTEPKVIAVDNLPNDFSIIHADIDLDGLTDLLLSDSYRPMIVLNKGNGNFEGSDINLHQDWGSSITISDFENDGDIDIIKLGNNGQHQGFNYLYKNQLADLNVVNEPPAAPATISARYESGKAIFTWSPSSDDRTPVNLITYNVSVTDSNGKIWLSSLTNEAGTFRRQLGPGNAGLSTTITLNNLPAGVYHARVQALDASFELSSWSPNVDVTVAAGVTNLSVERILLNKIELSWQGATFAESAIVVERKTTETEWVVIAELPSGSATYIDSDLEYNKFYQYRVFETSGDVTTATSNITEWNTNMWMLSDADMANIYGSLDVADFTGDGRMDLVVNGGMIYDGHTEDLTRATFENTNTGWAKRDISPSDLPHTARISFTDLNGDFKPDLYQHGYTWDSGYKTETFLNNGDKSFSTAANLFTQNTLSIESYYDFDMDNDLDVTVSLPDTYPKQVQVYENNGDGNYSFAESTSCYSCSQGVVADFDKDGDEDVIRTESGTHYLYVNTPEGIVQSGISFSEYETVPAVTDYNNDGWPDIVLLSYSYYGGGKIYKNVGLQNGTFPQFQKLTVDLSAGEPSLLSGDFDHDGQTDLAVISPHVNVLLSKSNDVFEEYEVPLLRVSSHNAGLIDFDNDGDLDILFMGYYLLNHKSDITRKAKVLLNQMIVADKGISNVRPNAPVNLRSVQDSLGIHLTWDPPQDDHTLSEGLTYDVVLFRDGKVITKGAHNPATGQRTRLTPGKSTSGATFNNLLIGEYSWKVQAIDASYAASDLSMQGTFVFLPPPPIVKDTVIYSCGRKITLSATGTDIQWYKDKALTELLASGEFIPQESQTVYVTQTINGYRGIPKRVQITIIEKPPVPTFSSQNPVTICEWWTGAVNLWAEGQNVQWYGDESLTNLLSDVASVQVPALTATYFVTQTIAACESEGLKVDVEKVNIDARLYYNDGKIWVRETEADAYFWYRDGVYFHSTIIPNIPFDGAVASYTVVVNKKQCQEYSDPFVTSEENITAIENGPGTSFDVFPNPASSRVSVKSRHANAVIRIFDARGKLVYESSLSHVGERTIDTGKWTNGVYVIMVDNGKNLSMNRLVIAN